MNISSVGQQVSMSLLQQQQSLQNSAAQNQKSASAPDGDGDHGVEPHKGQSINLLA